MPWLDSFAVGDPRTDAEHRALMESCNDFCRLASRGGTQAEIAAVISRLATALADHMDNEEALFSQIRFPGRDRHMAEHRRLRAHLADLTAHAGRPDPIPDLTARASTLRAGLVEHVLRYDLAYKTWVEEAGRGDARPGENMFGK